jgi:PEP-CTERM motif
LLVAKYWKNLVILIGILGLSLASQALAAVRTFNDPAAFQTALAGKTPTVQGFETLPLGTVITSGDIFDGVQYTFLDQPATNGRVFNAFNRIGTRSLEADNQFGFFFPGQRISINFLSPVIAVGGFFNVAPSLGDSVSLFLVQNGFINVLGGGASDSPDTNGLYFLGLISDTSFTNVFFGATLQAASGFNFDNLTYVNAAIPEPASWLTMVLGFGLVGGFLRNARKTNGLHYIRLNRLSQAG